jgi:pimeloyl-ACP methyl ester carboxylesterase
VIVEPSKFRTSDHQTLVWDMSEGPQRPVILLHGLGQQRRFWDTTSQHLGSHTVVRIDQRCHGESDTPIKADLSIARCGLDVVELADRLDLKDPLVVGHSWGASVALAAGAAGNLDVLLIDGGLMPLSALGDWQTIRPRFIPPLTSFSVSDVASWLSESGVPPEIQEASVEAVRHGYREISPGLLTTKIGAERHMAVLDELASYSPLEDFKHMAVNLRSVSAIVAGNLEDERLSAVGNIQKVFPDLRVAVWPDAIHDVPLQSPQLTAAFISATARGETQ